MTVLDAGFRGSKCDVNLGRGMVGEKPLQGAFHDPESRKEAAPTRPLLQTRRARLKKRENQSVEGPFKFLTIVVPPGASLKE